MSNWRRWAFDPLLAFVAIALVVGSVLSFMLPLFAGNDEATHFVRAYQMSTGQIVPESAPPHTRAGSGACVPQWLAIDYQAQQLVELVKLNPRAAIPPLPIPRTSHVPTPAEKQAFDRYFTELLPRCDGGRHYFIDTSTFAWYSPLAYVPTAIAIAVGRGFGWSSVGLERAGRLAQLTIVILLIAFAIRRTPWAKWVFAAVSLTPLALVVSSTIRPDAMTTGVALVVIASALRAVEQRGFTRRTFVDAVIWSTLLGLSKPTYWVIAGAFLAVLVGASWREQGVLATLRNRGWQPIVPLAIAAAASTVWQTAQRNRFICDVRFFGLKVNTKDSVHEILTKPHQFLGGLIRVVRDHRSSWLREIVQIDPRITGAHWPLAIIAIVLLGFLVLALRPTGDVVPRLGERVLYGLVALAFFVALAAGFAVYCSAPGKINSIFFTARFLLPLLVLALLALTPGARLGRLLARQPLPPVVALSGFYATWLVVVSHAVS